MKWFQVKEKSAGKKRLLLCWYLYKILGKGIVKHIAFGVALITYITNKDLRSYSHSYFETLSTYSNSSKFKPSFKNKFKQVLSYANSLVDKMEVFAGRFKEEDIVFVDKEIEQELYLNIRNKKGIFFICNHIGNVEVLRTLIHGNKYNLYPNISIFLQQNQCKIFNNFVNNILKEKINVTTYPIEDIDISTAIEIEDKVNNGGIIFMAGDRIPANNTTKTTVLDMFNKKIELPIGVFRFAQMMPAEIYFISCLKDKNKYKVYVSKVNRDDIDILQKQYVNFMIEMILNSPFQFYHFYNFFMVE